MMEDPKCSMEAAFTDYSTTVDLNRMYSDKEQCKAYVEYRPQYLDELFKAVVDYCKETNPNPSVAVDVGCGPGMSTLGFAKYFDKVIGVDLSPTQIEVAPKDVPNVEFRVGSSDKLPGVEAGSVDLFCAGTAFHYMPKTETFAEADRVLKPGGTIAIFGYSKPKSSNPEVDAAIEQLYKKLLPYWPTEVSVVMNRLRAVSLPYPGWTRNDDIKAVGKASLEEFLGYVSSLWPFVSLQRDHGQTHLLEEVEASMKEAIQKANGPSGDLTFEIVWEFYLLLGHKPAAS